VSHSLPNSHYTVCPTRYRTVIIQCVPLATETRHFFNNSNTNEDIVCCVRNEKECVCSAPNCCDTEQQYPH